MRRRDFLAAGVTGSTLLSGAFTGLALGEDKSPESRSNAPRLARRAYGKTGIQLSIIGFPGFAMRDMTAGRQEHVNRLVAESIERGVNYFDVAASYGNAEAVVGPALGPYRKNVFLSSKTGKRTAEGAAAELKRSFELLKTDYLDLYNLHHISDVTKDVDAAFGKGGAMEVLLQARKEGRVRHLGFSAHSAEAALAAMDRYDFDSAIFPINFACMIKGKFGPQIIERCKQKGVAMLALKAMARQQWQKNDPKRSTFPICWYEPLTQVHEAELGLRYSLSQPIVAALPPSNERMYRLAMALGMDFEPITPEQTQSLESIAKDLNPVFSAA